MLNEVRFRLRPVDRIRAHNYSKFSFDLTSSPPSTSMPRCPRCSKRCKTDRRLLQHMNHPSTKCIQFFDELIRISEAVGQTRLKANQRSKSKARRTELYEDVLMNSPDSAPHRTLEDGYPNDIPLTNMVDLPEQQDSQSELKHHTETYPGAAQTYGKGDNFMSGFDGDQYAGMREENLYYPWASRPEWELAAFLLRSSLSMAAIDQLLTLDLVSTFDLFYLYLNLDPDLPDADETATTIILNCTRPSRTSRDPSCWADVEVYPKADRISH